MVIEGEYQGTPDLPFPPMTHIIIKAKGASANPSDMEGLIKQVANGSRGQRPELNLPC